MLANILIVENNKTFSNQIKKLLETEKYAVYDCGSALDAYKITTRHHVDMIVSNLQLPKVNGLHLAKKLNSRQLTSTIPILFFGKANIFNERVIQRIDNFGHSFLTLPLNKVKLLAQIEKILSPLTQPEDEVEQAQEQGPEDPLQSLQDTSQVDTDKFNQRKIQESISASSRIRFKVQESAQPEPAKPENDYEASRVLAEITQQAEENLSNIVASEEKTAPIIRPSGTVNYLGWWGFKIRPFSNTPDSRFYFNSKQHSEAITRLMYAVENMEGLAVLIGKIGSGKTTLARRMLESFDPSEYVVALMVIIHSAITPDWLLRKIALQLGVRETESQKLLLIGQLYQRLVEIYESGKKAVILIDEAQMLQTRELMEEFRGLLNLEVPGKKLLTFVFFGLEELNQHLALDEPLKQRIALKYTLHSFDRPATRSYILHRLKVASVEHPLLSEDAINLVYQLSNGTPRLINTLCNNALLEGYFLKKRYIDQNLVRGVGDNLDLSED